MKKQLAVFLVILLVPFTSAFEDIDNDGLTENEESKYGTDPTNPDTDEDGIPDGAEIKYGTNPLDSDSKEVSAITGSASWNLPVKNFLAGVLSITILAFGAIFLYAKHNKIL